MSSPPFLLFFFLILAGGGAADLAGDRAALVAFHSSVGRYVSWNLTAASPCTWQGVTCEEGRVTVLRLPGSGLIGEVPGAVGNLTALKTLSLRFNALSGPLPSDLASLTQLRSLYLQGNKFDGQIATSLFSLSNLIRLNLADNRFSGDIPAAINRLTRLETLYLENNNLTGQIPDLNDLPNLNQFNVSFNQLNGSIPQKLRSLPVDSFMNTSLCGGPRPACPWEVSPLPAAGSKKSKLPGGAIAGIAIGAAVAVLILIGLLILCCRKKSSNSTARSAGVAAAPAVRKEPEVEIPLTDKRVVGEAAPVPPSAAAAGVESGGKRLIFFGEGPRVYDLEDLLRASAEVLGKGTFGTAYKAAMRMGVTVAVKRLKEVNISEREFRERIMVIGAMEHENLVGLRAYYYSKDERLLVFDYMTMGSLSSLLHGNRGSGRTPLNWETRLSISLGAAKGISYIHATNPSASHGNIKSSNVLLNRSYEAKISDHGLNTLAGSTPTPNRVAGYQAPEVTDVRRVSQKADVYSFGVLLLELLTGKAPAQAAINDEGVDLARWVQSVVKEEWTSEVFDLELLRYQNVEEEMVQLLQLAMDCSDQYPDRRPDMSEVVRRVEGIRSTSLPPQDADKEEVDD